MDCTGKAMLGDVDSSRQDGENSDESPYSAPRTPDPLLKKTDLGYTTCSRSMFTRREYQCHNTSELAISLGI